MKNIFDSYRFTIRHLLVWFLGFTTLLIALGVILIFIPFFSGDNTKLFRLTLILTLLFIIFLSQLPIIVSPFVENTKSNFWRIIILILMLPAIYFISLFLVDQFQTIFIAPFNSNTILKLSPVIVLVVYAVQIFTLLKIVIFGRKDEG